MLDELKFGVAKSDERLVFHVNSIIHGPIFGCILIRSVPTEAGIFFFHIHCLANMMCLRAKVTDNRRESDQMAISVFLIHCQCHHILV
jgi:hypothetical protein